MNEIEAFNALLERVADALGMATSNEMDWSEEVDCMVSIIQALRDENKKLKEIVNATAYQ